MSPSCCKEQINGSAPASELENQTQTVLRKVLGALGNTLVSFTNKTNSCLTWELSIHEFRMRQSRLGFPMRNNGSNSLTKDSSGPWVVCQKRKWEGMEEQSLKSKGSSGERCCLLSLDVVLGERGRRWNNEWFLQISSA
ncbi:hypothetical protein L3X38_010207 [Prunus dulcis]|uniref:Uncharacterized protein n=1 Tax=Prunus dulcis TaxID=3755 RepID=A0AAD4WHU4_PRUDU|nr:hypothetical protein L3X38_010207 [Prunus dulcis]